MKKLLALIIGLIIYIFLLKVNNLMSYEKIAENYIRKQGNLIIDL